MIYTTQGYSKEGPNLTFLSLNVIYWNFWIRLVKSITEAQQEHGKHRIVQHNSALAGQQATAQLKVHPGQ